MDTGKPSTTPKMGDQNDSLQPR